MGARKQSVVTAGAVPSTGRRLPRPRASFAQYAPEMMQLYESFKQELYMSGFDPATVRAQLAMYASKLAALKAARIALAKLQEETTQLASSVWSGTLAVYERGQSAARTNPDIKRAIADFEHYMKRSRRPKTPTGGSTPPATGTPPVAA